MRLLKLAASVLCMRAVGALSEDAAAPTYLTFALKDENATAITVDVLDINAKSGNSSYLQKSWTAAPPLAPCGTAYVPKTTGAYQALVQAGLIRELDAPIGLLAVPAGDSVINMLSVLTGEAAYSITLNQTFVFASLAAAPPGFGGSPTLIGMGAATADGQPNGFIDIVSVDIVTGEVSLLAPTIQLEVMECTSTVTPANPAALTTGTSAGTATTAAGAFKGKTIAELVELGVLPATGYFTYVFIGPLQMQLVGVGVLWGKGEPADSIVVDNGTIVAMAPFPQPLAAAADGTADAGAGYSSDVILLIAADGAGSLQGLQSLNLTSGNMTMLVPLPPQFMGMSQGALIYDGKTQVATALAQYQTDEGTPNVLINFQLAGADPAKYNYTYVTLTGPAQKDAANGLWNLAPRV